MGFPKSAGFLDREIRGGLNQALLSSSAVFVDGAAKILLPPVAAGYTLAKPLTAITYTVQSQCLRPEFL